MKKTKLLVVSQVLALTAVLSACGSNNNNNAAPVESSPAASQPAATESAPAANEELKPEDGASLVVWESKEFREHTESIAKAFTEQTGVPVKIEEVNEPDQINKLINDGPAGVGADVVVYPHDNL